MSWVKFTVEDLPYGTSVFSITATDGDIGSQGEVEYSIIDGDTYDNFAIDVNGTVTVKNEVDYEQTGSPVLLTILAEDKGVSPKRSATTTVTVTVTDVTGDAPIDCPSESIVIQLVENVAISGALVEDIDCIDPDGSPLTYSITPAVTEFDIDSGTGEVTLSTGTSLDYDDPATARVYTLEISVTDGTETRFLTMTVNLLPFNDFPPTLTDFAVTIPENQAVDTVIEDASTHATDGDEETHGISSYTVPVSGMTKFALDPTTGEIILTSPLDREVEDNYQLILKVIDGGGQSATATLSVTVSDINDNTPQCLATAFNVEKSENEFPLTAVSNVAGSDELQCSDPDDSPNGDLTYTLTQIDPATPVVFEWIVGTGLETTLDYEANANHQYKLQLKVADGGTPQRSTDIDITVTVLPKDEGPPVFPVAPACDVTIPETDVIDKLVVSCAATDPDSPDSPDGLIIYEITGGNTDDFFYIDENGDIRVKNAIDYESLGAGPHVYNLDLSAKDATSTGTGTAKITITDENDYIPVCTAMSFVENVDEETAADVFTLSCTDEDSTDGTLTYTLDNDYGGTFSVPGGVVKIIATDFETDPTSYKLKVLVTDTAAHQIAVEGTVIIDPVNEATPAFQPTAAYAFTQDEDIDIHSTIGTVLATDADSPLTGHGQVTYSIAAACSCPQFEVDENGNIILVESLDYETATSHTITVEAVDSDPANTVTATVTLTLNDVNDNPPIFASSVYSGNIQEEMPSGQTVANVPATDADPVNPNGEIEYVITGGEPDPSSSFDIDNAGAITTKGPLDYDNLATQLFRLYIEARDLNGAAGYNSATANVTIQVTPTNDNAPSFTGPLPYAASISEATSVGTSIYQISATDGDLGLDGKFFFSLAPGSYFMIDELTGIIRVKAQVDRDIPLTSHTVSITVTDRGTPPQSSTQDVVITITDFNDNAPFCTSTYALVSVDEDDSSGTLIGASCSDADDGVNANIFYSIADVDGSPISSPFAINAAGVLSLAGNLDFETKESHSITVHVYDGGTPSLTSTVVVTVNVNPVNEFTPTIGLPAVHSIDISENTAINDVILTVPVSDGDSGEDVYFSFSAPSPKFRIDRQTGEIYLVSKVNAGDLHTLTVEAEDTGTNPGTKTGSITLNINVLPGTNNPPSFSQNLYFGSVNEDASVSSMAVPLSVSDVDGDNVAVSIAGGNVHSIFGVNAANEIYVADNTNLDAETQDRYILILNAIDDGAPSLTATATAYINILQSNEHAPVFTQASYTGSVSESASSDTTVLTVSADDADDGVGGILTYSIVSGSDGKFAIDPLTGDIVVVDFLDAETKATYTLQVQVSDNTATDTATVTITILDENDENPYCSPDFYYWQCQENTPVETVLGQLNCNDDGGGGTITYYIVDGNDFNTFEIPQASLPEVVVRTSPNYEQKQTFQLLVRVVDSGFPPVSSTATVVVDIIGMNEYTPDFGASSITVEASEALSEGTTVIDLNAADADTGMDGDVSYLIMSGNEEEKFHMIADTGEVTILKKLDWESIQSYSLVVEARDLGSPARTGTLTLNIRVTDANDNVPYCDPVAYMGTVPEDSYIGTSIIGPTCMDGDAGSNFTYSIASGNEAGRFAIDPSTGMVLTNDVLDAETNDTYVLTIHVSDGLSYGTAVITVSVQGVNEYPPIFSPPVYVTSVPENAAADTPVQIVTTTDGDALNDGLVMYTITGGNIGDVFKINSSSGEVLVKRALDRETIDVYDIEITATDLAAPGEEKTALTTVRVTITDINDQTPYFDPPNYANSVDEDAPVNFVVTSLNVLDNDIGSPNTDHVVTILTGNDLGHFGVSGDNIVVSGTLDYDSQTKSYFMTVEVKDLGVPQLSSTGTVAITILPVNEEPPDFDEPTGGYIKTIPEDSLPGASVIKVEALDLVDDPQHVHSRIRYEISGGNEDGKFTIDRFSGIISTVDVVDRETRDSYTLEITAKDSLQRFGDELNDTTVVQIGISDVNDNVPIFTPSLYSITVMETAPINSVLMQLTATDIDAGVNSQIDYEIVSGNTGNDFEFISNELRTFHALAWHRTEFYRIRVKATDRGTPARSGYAIITVVVKPINQARPILPHNTDTVAIPEDIPVGSIIYTATASDNDYGIHGEMEYYIVEGNDGSFHINKETGDISVAGFLDREFLEEYNLNITVFDRAENDSLIKADSFILTITLTDVNDNDPICEKPIDIVHINENPKPIVTILTTVKAHDIDAGDNADLSYKVVSGIQQNDLLLEPDRDVVPLAILDREMYEIYSMVIEVTDNGIPQRTALCAVEIHLIDVNDNDPLITPNSVELTIDENGPLYEELWVFTATDPDAGLNGETFFTIIGGDDEGHFNIDENSGRLITTVSLDREEIKFYELQIKVSDKGDPARTGLAGVDILVNDLNDNGPICKQPFNRRYTTNVREDMTVGMTAMVIRSYDRDDWAKKNTQRTYRIMSGGDGTWSIDPEQGNIYLIGSLNMALRSSYSFVIRIEDDKDTTMYDECTANINVVAAVDGVPLVEADVIITAPENTPHGTVLGTIDCNDFDADICGGNNFVYEIVSGDYAEHFYLEPTTGSFLVETDDLDYETIQQYNFLVLITRGNGMEAYGVLVVQLTDQNDHAPEFLSNSPYASSIREDSALGTTVLHVTAKDEDAGEDSVLSYSISSALADNGPVANKYFMINSASGIISVKEELDSELYREIELSVLAVDSGSPPLTASTTAVIQIVDVNDNAPVFSPSFYSGEMSYLNLLGEPIITLTANDADQTSIVQYSVQDSSSVFTVNPSSGDVSLATGARPTVYTKYAFTATGIDTGNPPLTSVAINCRIDTFDPYLNLIGIHISGRTKQEILDNEEEFLAPLTSIISTDYPTGRIGLSHITVIGDVVTATARRRLLQSSGVIVWIYGVADDTADVESGLANAKNFISQEYLYSKFASDEKGTPAAELSALSDYPATFVEKYTSEASSFWTSAGGIATIAVLSLLGLLTLIGLSALIYYCCCASGLCAGGIGDGGCCRNCWSRFVQAIKDCCRRKPKPEPEPVARGKRHGWGEHVYKEYHREDLPVKKKGQAGESVLALPSAKGDDAAGKFKSLASKARGGGAEDDISKIRQQHEADKVEFERVQGQNKARAEQDLQDKLADRRSRRYGNNSDD
ncbi:protocadherin Fat 4-like [Ptychodera flava]|uniref:protocadherin Fat 4-like n=1 Tax=Ptychodera flava TaxID=63121 RepID=UPI00396A4B7F